MYSSDEEAIRRRAEQCAETWNRHDMSTFASLFTEDSDCVTLGGDWLRGRDEIEQDLVKDHATVFRESQLMITGVWVKFLRPDIAVAHVTWELNGLLGRDGQKVVRGLRSERLSIWSVDLKHKLHFDMMLIFPSARDVLDVQNRCLGRLVVTKHAAVLLTHRALAHS